MQTTLSTSSEHLSQIFQYLDHQSLATVKLVCKLWKQIAEHMESPVESVFQIIQKNSVTEFASLLYLFQYQHYNADMIEKDLKVFGYPQPVYAPVKTPQYFRSSECSCKTVLEPWLKRKVLPIMERSFKKLQSPLSYIFVYNSLASRFIKLVCQDRSSRQFKSVIFVEIDLEDLTEHNLLEVLTMRCENALKSKKATCYLFYVTCNPWDCILIWGVQVKKDRLSLISLNSVFEVGKQLPPFLRGSGAVPDRVVLNQMLASEFDITKPNDYEELNLPHRSGLDVQAPYASAAWISRLHGIQNCEFQGDAGSQLLRDAILKWALLFKDLALCEFSEPLLISQVSPWLSQSNGVKDLSKAFQNFCEIAMFCIQAHPEKFDGLSLQKLVREQLHPSAQVGLFPYAMSGTLFSLMHILEKFNRPVNITSLVHNYFETIQLINNLSKSGQIELDESAILDDESVPPDILIADIHPNNAAKEKIFQNDIGRWVTDRLSKSEKPLVLFLDITMNQFTDKVLQNLLEKLQPFIEKGKLEVYGIQSLAKLVQLGGDNFSGGLAFYIGETDIEFPKAPSCKEAYFSIMLASFNNLIDRYFLHIRENTNYMYQELEKRFEKISDLSWPIEGQEIGQQFCAARVTFNGDDQTVYIALNFEPLFKRLNLDRSLERPRKKIAEKVRCLILSLATDRGLSLTGRLSFGFVLSNISDTHDALRLSIGIETREELNNYLTAIEDVVLMMSGFAVCMPGQFDINRFEEFATKIFLQIRAGDFVSPQMDVFEEDVDENGGDILSKIDQSCIRYEHQMVMLDCKRQKSTTDLFETRGRKRDIDDYTPPIWSHSSLLRLIYQIELNPAFITIRYDAADYYWVQSNLIKDRRSPFLYIENTVIDDASGIAINLLPNFELSAFGRIFSQAQVYISMDAFDESTDALIGSAPIPVRKLTGEKRSRVFNKCVHHHLSIEPMPSMDESCCLLKFNEVKGTYLGDIQNLFAKAKNLTGALHLIKNYLNHLDFKNLPHQPVNDEQPWDEYQPPQKHLFEIVRSIGYQKAYSFRACHADIIKQIENSSCRKHLIQASLQRILRDSYNPKFFLTQKEADKASLFLQEFDRREFIVEEALEDWIVKMGDYINRHPEMTSRLKPFLTLIFPALADLYDKPRCLLEVGKSCILIAMADLLEFQPLKVLLNGIEDQLCQIDVDNFYPLSMTSYMDLFIQYPLTKKNRVALTQSIRHVSPEKKWEWLVSHSFYFSPIDNFMLGIIGITPEDDVFSVADASQIQEFLYQTGCLAILLQVVPTADEPVLTKALRWAIMSQDLGLFKSILAKVVKKDIPTKNLKGIASYLNQEDPIQLRLHDLIMGLIEIDRAEFYKMKHRITRAEAERIKKDTIQD